VGFAVPGPVPRIANHSLPVTRKLAIGWTRSASYRGTLSPRLGGSLAATLTRIADGVFFTDCFRVASSLAADFRRARTQLLRTVFALESRTPYSGAFSYFAGHFWGVLMASPGLFGLPR